MAIIPSYYEGLLSEDDMSSLRNQALASGLLSAGAAFSRAGAPSLMPQGSGFSNALQGFQEGYQGQVDTALQNMLKATQVQELVRKQKEAQQLKQLYASAATPKYQTIPGIQTAIPSEVGPAVTTAPATQQLVGYDYDLAKIIPQLQASGQFGAIKDIADSMKSLRQSGLMAGGGMAQSPSPFAAYTQATSPQVRTLAAQLEQGFKTGVIDEETAYKRLDSLARMEDSYVSRQIASGERMDARQAAAAERELRRAEGGKPTEAEQKAAGFAQRMELSNQLLKDIESKVYTQQAAGKDVGTMYPTARTQALGSIPLVGGYLENIGSSTQQQLYRQAQENWVRANLRKESGAVIGADEMKDEIKTYFPQPGDRPEKIAQKELARQVTQDAMRTAAGKSYVPFDMKKYKKDRELE
jgi:hypothetical protein